MKKPATGWLHDDTALSRGDGVYYPVKVSTKSLTKHPVSGHHSAVSLLSLC